LIKTLPLAVSIQEAAKMAGVSRSTVYGAIKSGELKLRKLGSRSLVLTAELHDWLTTLPVAEICQSETPEAAA
jgi:excisionase family DNA binding protein